jgi:3-dehydroquinate dehydratase II
MTKVLVLNGPNLNRLGSREPDVYGTSSYTDLVSALTSLAANLNVDVDVRQTNDEAELISWLHQAVDSKSDVIINPAAFTHYSYALRDACAIVTSSGLRLIEVHISNPHAREEFRHTSVISAVATGVIAGFGQNSYLLALQQLTH